MKNWRQDKFDMIRSNTSPQKQISSHLPGTFHCLYEPGLTCHRRRRLNSNLIALFCLFVVMASLWRCAKKLFSGNQSLYRIDHLFGAEALPSGFD